MSMWKVMLLLKQSHIMWSYINYTVITLLYWPSCNKWCFYSSHDICIPPIWFPCQLPNAKTTLRNEENLHFHSNNHFTQAIIVWLQACHICIRALLTPAVFICIVFQFCAATGNIKAILSLLSNSAYSVFLHFLHFLPCVSSLIAYVGQFPSSWKCDKHLHR